MFSVKLFKTAGLSASGTMHEWLLVSSAFSCTLLAIRITVTSSTAYLFLPWNLFLAFIPYWITRWIMHNPGIIANKWKLMTSLALWLLFVPNSFYIITDLFHLTHIKSAPRWFDLLLIFSFAWNGILCGIISLRRVEVIINMLKGKGFSLVMVFGVMWLNAFGIYIGRYGRYNSWDIITDPFSLAGEIVDMLLHPFEYGFVWGMTLCYAGFITVLYFTIRKLGEMLVVTNAK
jgi:uncharacterized membrane protein